MSYLSYVQELIVSILLLLLISHVILDLLPHWYQRLRHALARVRNRLRIILIVTSFFLL